MTELKKHWMTDWNGRLALVQGATDRDSLISAGWNEIDTPSPEAQVLVVNTETGVSASVAVGALEVWETRGWVPDTNIPADVELIEPFVPPVEPTVPAPAEPAVTTKPAAGADKKEKDRA